MVPVADPGFPRGGGAGGERQHTILPKVPKKKCMKLKEFGPPGWGEGCCTSKILLYRSATGYVLKISTPLDPTILSWGVVGLRSTVTN